MNSLQQILAFALALHLVLLCGFGQGVQGEASAENLVATGKAAVAEKTGVRRKRAPGWGKRSPEAQDLDAFDGETDELLDSSEEADAEKRAPGWGKRAPGWGKRAPGWGKRAPGWGKRAPGWGKRNVMIAEAEEKRAPGWGKRAPGWGKRAPGWGKRAPGWGKRAPGWGKRSLNEVDSVCDVMKEELELHMSKVNQAVKRMQAFCGGSFEVPEISYRK